MSTVAEIESALQAIPLSDARKVAEWLRHYLDEKWDRQIVSAKPKLISPHIGQQNSNGAEGTRLCRGDRGDFAARNPRGSPFQMPTRLADGLGLESGLEFRCRNSCAPSSTV